MENLIFSLNATMPVFLMMCFGFGLRKTWLVDDTLASGLNHFVFRAALPLMLFSNLQSQDFHVAWNGRFVLFCMAATVLSVALVALVSRIFAGDGPERGEFIQAAYRSSAAIVGMAFIENIYGEGSGTMGALMILGSVPLYNVFAVAALTITAEYADGKRESKEDGRADRKAGGKTDRSLAKKTVKGIITNPILLGIAAGLLWSLLRIPLHPILSSAIQSVGRCATPLGLIAMGAAFDPGAVRKKIRPVLAASVIKLVGLAALFLPLAVLLGFRRQELVALAVMLGSSTTVSSYVMAVSMGHEGSLTSGTIMATTLGCSFTLTFWLFVLRNFALI